MTEFIPSPYFRREFDTPIDVNSEVKQNKRGRSSIDEFEERTFEEDEGGYGDMDGHLDFNPEKRIRNNSFGNGGGGHVEERHHEYVNPEKRSRTTGSIRQPNFSSQAGFSFNDSSTTILRLEGELRTERYQHSPYIVFVKNVKSHCNSMSFLIIYFFFFIIYRQEMQVKEEQLHIACLENKSISDQLKVVEARNTKLSEENAILKRAVNIQEGRMKGLNQHNLQLQQILTQAAQRISQLENALGVKNQANDVDSSFNPNRPPDVF